MPSTQSFLLIRRPEKLHSKMQLFNTNINSAGFSRVLLWANSFLQCPLSPGNNCATTTCPTWGFVLTLLLERKRRWWRYQSSSSFSSGLLRWKQISERPIRRLCVTRTLAAYIWPAKSQHPAWPTWLGWRWKAPLSIPWGLQFLQMKWVAVHHADF